MNCLLTYGLSENDGSRHDSEYSDWYIAHVFAQTRENVNFLATHGYITQADAADISRRLSESRSNASVTSGMQALSVVGPSGDSAPSPFRRNVPAPPPRIQRARALWAYNESGQVRSTVFKNS